MASCRAEEGIRRDIVGAGGHGLDAAYYLAKEHGITNVAVIEMDWLGGGNTGRNMTIIRSNYLYDESAGRSGADVVLVDELPEAGGMLLSEPAIEIDGAAAWTWLSDTVDELGSMRNVRMLSRTTAIGYCHRNMVGLCQKLTDHLADLPNDAPRERMWRIRAGHIILAQDAIERPLVFNGNDRPGIMLAGAAQTYLNRFGVTVGNSVVVVT